MIETALQDIKNFKLKRKLVKIATQYDKKIEHVNNCTNGDTVEGILEFLNMDFQDFEALMKQLKEIENEFSEPHIKTAVGLLHFKCVKKINNFKSFQKLTIEEFTEDNIIKITNGKVEYIHW